jgi:hypothetical protein
VGTRLTQTAVVRHRFVESRNETKALEGLKRSDGMIQETMSHKVVK